MTQTLLLAIRLFWFLVVAHLICDYHLQGPNISNGKNKFSLEPRVVPWSVYMVAHGMIHGAAILLITRSLLLAVIETVTHMAIDHNKNAGRLSFKVDQLSHVLLKLCYAIVAVLLMDWKGIW